MEMEPNRRDKKHEPHRHRVPQHPPAPPAPAPRLDARSRRNGPRAQSTPAASPRAHSTRPVGWLQAGEICSTGGRLHNAHRGPQYPANPHALAPRLPARATRIGPRAQGTSAASPRAHGTRPVPPWPPGWRNLPCQKPTCRRHISRSTRRHPTIHGDPDTYGSSRIDSSRRRESNPPPTAAKCACRQEKGNGKHKRRERGGHSGSVGRVGV